MDVVCGLFNQVTHLQGIQDTWQDSWQDSSYCQLQNTKLFYVVVVSHDYSALIMLKAVNGTSNIKLFYLRLFVFNIILIFLVL